MSTDENKTSAWLMKMLTVMPGFVSLAVAQYIVGQGDLDEFEIIGYSLLLSFITFLAALTIFRAYSWLSIKIKNALSPNEEAPPSSPNLSFSLPFAFVVLAVAIAIGMLSGHVYSNDVLLRVLESASVGSGQARVSFSPPLVHLMALNQRARIGERDGRPQPLEEEEAWVVLFTKSGNRLEGYPMLYSLGEASHSEIYLSPACSTGGIVEPWPGPGVLVRGDEIESIGFVDREKSLCLEAWTQRDQSSAMLHDSSEASISK